MNVIESIRNILIASIVIPIKITMLILAGWLLYLSSMEGTNILFIVLAGMLLPVVIFPFTTDGYYKMYRVAFPLGIIAVLIATLSYGPIGEVLQSFFAIMETNGFWEAMKNHFFDFLIIAVGIYCIYYLWRKFFVRIFFKEVVRIEKNGKLSAVIGRSYWITGRHGKYDRWRYLILNKLSDIASKIASFIYNKKYYTRNIVPSDMPVIYIVQAGFPFFNPRIDMIKLYSCELAHIKMPGYLTVKYPGHLEIVGHNKLAPSVDEITGDRPYVTQYHTDVEMYLDMHAIRTQRAVTLDAELNKSQIMKSSAYMPTTLKEWAEKLAKRKDVS